MSYIEDWQAMKTTMRAWWARQNDRPVLAVYAPRPRADDDSGPPAPRDLEQKWCDPQYRIALARWHFERTYFGGAACPIWWPNVGPTSLSAYYGCPVVLGQETVWQEPIVTDWAGQEPAFEQDNRWWRLTVALTEAAVQDAQGQYLVGITDLGDAFDAISHLSGPDNACIGLAECPDRIVRMRDRLLDDWFRCYEELYRICRRNQDGSTHWLGVWSPGRSYVLQCDFSCMISPAMFEQFVLPELQRQTEWLDTSVYHLDGPGAIKHLDMILHLPRLNAVQWVPGAGSAPPTGWIELYRRIQSAGKGVHIWAPPEQVRPLLEQLAWPGLYIVCHARSVEEAEHVLALPETIAAERARMRITT